MLLRPQNRGSQGLRIMLLLFKAVCPNFQWDGQASATTALTTDSASDMRYRNRCFDVCARCGASLPSWCQLFLWPSFHDSCATISYSAARLMGCGVIEACATCLRRYQYSSLSFIQTEMRLNNLILAGYIAQRGGGVEA